MKNGEDFEFLLVSVGNSRLTYFIFGRDLRSTHAQGPRRLRQHKDLYELLNVEQQSLEEDLKSTHAQGPRRLRQHRDLYELLNVEQQEMSKDVNTLCLRRFFEEVQAALAALSLKRTPRMPEERWLSDFTSFVL
ncbi:hypothetical protein VNO77_19710 [Canavalia gladiata]|uniref:Uncharacterized protein n=1 Tax=Canavalia gladiata TaxID=3824 RepID=A0AAN9LS18_CANGL